MEDSKYAALKIAVQARHKAFRKACIAYINACKADFDAKLANGDKFETCEAEFYERMQFDGMVPSIPKNCQQCLDTCKKNAAGDQSKLSTCMDVYVQCVISNGDPK